MKKIIALLLALTMVFALVACASTEKPAETPAENQETEKPAENTPAEQPEETPAEQPEETPAAAGSVYYLNFKPEADEAWQKLAETYRRTLFSGGIRSRWRGSNKSVVCCRREKYFPAKYRKYPEDRDLHGR